jgi:ribosomal-protein-alanine N-acetyltransferase
MNPAIAKSTPTLRRATPADAGVALSWSPTVEVLHHWAGPSARWPATQESFWEDINNADATTFALVAVDAGVVGLGQVRYREKTYGHLARVIVSPQHRGQGFGRILCSALMREAPKLHAITGYSLWVYSDNTAAIHLYESLGYVRSIPHATYPNMFLMLAPLTAVSP